MTMSKPLLGLALITATLLGCSFVTGLLDGSNANQSPSSANGVQSSSPQATPPEPLPWPDDEPLPSDLEDILHVGIEHGYWTEGEGLILLLRAYFGDVDSAVIPGFDQLPYAEANWLNTASMSFLQEQPQSPSADEIRSLHTALLPPEENLRRYVQPLETAARGPGLAAGAAVPPDQVLNCRALWREGFPESPPPSVTEFGEGDFPCFRSAVRHVDGHAYEVFYPEFWLQHMSERAQEIADRVADAMVKSYHVYKEYGNMGDATLVFLPWQAETYAGTVFSGHPSPWESCPIMIDIWSNSGQSMHSLEKLERITAHEMFHCFQQWNYRIGEASTRNRRWWTEGSAEYFSNVVYPDAQNKHRMLPFFDSRSLTSSIVEMRYENYVFFQHLANQHGNHWLTDAFHDFPLDAPLVEHQRVLESYVPQDDFHEFGRAYLEHKIPDTGGGFLPIEASYNDTYRFADETERQYYPAAFVLDRYRLEYDRLKRFEQSYDHPSDMRISELLDRLDDWIPARSEVRSFCQNADSILLLTSTDPGSTKEVNFAIPHVEHNAWEMTTSTGQTITGNRGIYTGSAASPFIHLSQSDSTESEPLLNLTTGGVYIFETADGMEYSGRGEYSPQHTEDGTIVGEFTANFWADEWGPLRGDPPDFTATGSFEACPQE